MAEGRLNQLKLNIEGLTRIDKLKYNTPDLSQLSKRTDEVQVKLALGESYDTVSMEEIQTRINSHLMHLPEINSVQIMNNLTRNLLTGNVQINDMMSYFLFFHYKADFSAADVFFNEENANVLKQGLYDEANLTSWANNLGINKKTPNVIMAVVTMYIGLHLRGIVKLDSHINNRCISTKAILSSIYGISVTPTGIHKTEMTESHLRLVFMLLSILFRNEPLLKDNILHPAFVAALGDYGFGAVVTTAKFVNKTGIKASTIMEAFTGTTLTVHVTQFARAYVEFYEKLIHLEQGQAGTVFPIVRISKRTTYEPISAQLNWVLIGVINSSEATYRDQCPPKMQISSLEYAAISKAITSGLAATSGFKVNPYTEGVARERLAREVALLQGKKEVETRPMIVSPPAPPPTDSNHRRAT